MKGKLIHDAGGEFFELGEVSSIGRSPESAVPDYTCLLTVRRH